MLAPRRAPVLPVVASGRSGLAVRLIFHVIDPRVHERLVLTTCVELKPLANHDPSRRGDADVAQGGFRFGHLFVHACTTGDPDIFAGYFCLTWD